MGKFISIEHKAHIMTKLDCNNYNGRLVYIASWGWAIPGPVDSCFVFKQRASWSIGESEDIPVTPTPPALLFCDDSPFLLIFCDDFPPFFVVMLGAVTDSVLEANTRPLRIVYIRYMQFLIVNNTTHKCIN